jgi:hypothetical protein
VTGPRSWWIAGGLLLLAHVLVLASVAVPAPHSGGDNAAYLSLASSLASGNGYTELWDPSELPHAKYPPAYPLLLALAMVLGASTWGAFKLISAVLVGAAGLLVLAWAGARKGPVFGAVVAVLVVLSAGWVEASRWILSEPLFLVAALLALWGADRAGLRLRLRRRERVEGGGSGAEDALSPSAPAWLAVAAAATLLTLFTRTAGLPLLVGFLVLLAWERRWRALAGTLAVAAVPVLLWMLRGRRVGEGAYQDEFWLANPYDPALGTVGVGGLLVRVWTNLKIYVGEVLGSEWWGAWSLPAGALAVLGGVLVGLALLGWGRRLLRGEGGLAELFLPLYGGLVLLWPEVWSGDRFVLPLYPLLLAWAGEAVLAGIRAMPLRLPAPRAPSWLHRSFRPGPGVWPGTLVASLALLGLALPALGGVRDRAEVAAVCRELGAADPFACYGPAFQGFRDAAAWSGANLPADAVVINRKPRIFHALGGRPGRVFPFHSEPEPLLAQAEELGARYLLVDRVDNVSAVYLPALLRASPASFCWIRSWGPDTVLLGILPPDPGPARDPDLRQDGAEGIEPCGPGWTAGEEERTPRRWGHQVPVVVSPPLRRPR